jgi:hypothetical protein
MEKVQMDTLVKCLHSLEQSGFATQFKATPLGLLSLTTEITFQPTELTVAHFYRFEGESNPSDNAIVYAIETKTGEKGTLVDGYGTASDEYVTSFIKQVTAIHK